MDHTSLYSDSRLAACAIARYHGSTYCYQMRAAAITLHTDTGFCQGRDELPQCGECVDSDRQTLRIRSCICCQLSLCASLPSREEESPTWSAYVGKMFSAASNYLPAQVSDMMNQDRAFATVRLNIFGLKNVCALAT